MTQEQRPLETLIPVFVDVETYVDDAITLKRRTLRQYLGQSHLTTIAVAVGWDDKPQVFYTEKCPGPTGCLYVDDRLKAVLQRLADDPRYVFVAHNAAFDMRVLRLYMGVPHPKNVWCSMEGAMGTWPECLDGYGLGNLSEKLLPKGKGKFHLPLAEHTKAMRLAERKGTIGEADVSTEFWEAVLAIAETGLEWDGKTLNVDQLREILALYNIRDVEAMRDIYREEVRLLPGVEQGVALRTHHQRRHEFHIDADGLDKFVEALSGAILEAQAAAGEYLDEDQLKAVFNIGNNGVAQSVRYQRLKKVINNDIADEEFQTTSLKKLSPIVLARNPDAAALLQSTSRVGKMRYHQRRSATFEGVSVADVELGYMRATTGRFSSPSCGVGLNLHNVPKQDVAIAKPTRSMFRLPPHLCMVRGDLANVECRVESLLTQAKNGLIMFDPKQGGNLFVDPYIATWYLMTGSRITNKKDPIRQVSKSAVLGLGFIMSATGYARVLLTTLADKRSKVTEATLKDLIVTNGWRIPSSDAVLQIIKNTGCSQIVALAAYHVHKAYNDTFPEYNRTARWLVELANSIATTADVLGSATLDHARMLIDRAYTYTTAPDRNLINVTAHTDGLSKRVNMRVGCGFWVPTLTWREPYNRVVDFDNHRKALTIRKASGEVKPFTPQLAIENVTQAAARNAMCMGVEHLERLGFKDVIHVHDEVMIITERNRESVLRARDALTEAFGPKHSMPWGWSILIKPSEISITESLYEDEGDLEDHWVDTSGEKQKGTWDGSGQLTKPGRWRMIEENLEGCLENLP